MDSFRADTDDAGLEIAAHETAAPDFESAGIERTMSLRDRLLHLALVVLGAVLLTTVVALADTNVPLNASATNPDDLKSQIAARVAQILPDGMRIKGIGLEFTPPPGATLVNVAPGVAQLRSRYVMVQLQVNGRTMAYTATVDAERQVITPLRDVALGAPITGADVQTQWLEAFNAAPGALTAFPAEGELVAATALRAGEPLYPGSFTRAIAVRPGDIVNVLVKNGPVTVRTQLEARSAAAVGDTATMVNPQSGTPVTVSVTGPKAAELVMQ
jgi:flagella basal body P-ring formation protein FlgA